MEGRTEFYVPRLDLNEVDDPMTLDWFSNFLGIDFYNVRRLIAVMYNTVSLVNFAPSC